MGDTRFKNLYEALISQIDYCNMIESYGTEYVTFKHTNFDLLKVIFGGFYLTSIIDDYLIKKPDGTMDSKLISEFIKSLVKVIAKDNGNGYTLGDLSYKDEYTVLEKVRNKLAHGDFIVENEEIIFEEKGVQGKIKTMDFMKFIAYFDYRKDSYIKTGTSKKTLFFNYTDKKPIYNQSDLEKACNDIYILEITDYPIFPRTRNLRYCEVVRTLYDMLLTVQQDVVKKGLDQVDDVFKKLECRLKEEGVSIKYTMTKLSDTKEYPKIIEKYMINKRIYKQYPKKAQVTTITNIANRLMHGEFQKFDIQKGILLNEIILSKWSRNPKMSLTDMIKEQPKLGESFVHHIDSTIITSYLVAFNSLYEYGLEKGLTIQGAYNWISIYEGKSLDFSKLELDNVDDPNMLIEHTFTKYDTDISEYEKKNLERIDKLISKYQHDLDNYLNNSRNKNSEKEKGLREKIIEVQEEKIKLLETIKQLKEHYKTFDLDKYTRNINIIIHIRNAIAHGNVYIESCSDGKNIQDVEIIFKDYLDDELVYEKRLKVSEFVLIFSDINLNCIYSFLENNINDKSIIKQSFIEELNKRIQLRNN